MKHCDETVMSITDDAGVTTQYITANESLNRLQFGLEKREIMLELSLRDLDGGAKDTDK